MRRIRNLFDHMTRYTKIIFLWYVVFRYIYIENIIFLVTSWSLVRWVNLESYVVVYFYCFNKFYFLCKLFMQLKCNFFPPTHKHKKLSKSYKKHFKTLLTASFLVVVMFCRIISMFQNFVIFSLCITGCFEKFVGYYFVRYH